MKTMTCKQLGGACDKEFHAKTFEEMAEMSRKHGMEMYQNGDKDHIEVMKEMRKLMSNSKAMKKWIESKQKEFDTLPEGKNMKNKMNPMVHFEIPANDVQRAKKFYEKIFGWKIEKFQMPDDEYWMVYTTETSKEGMPKKPGAINGGMMKRKNPEQPFMNYIHVESIDNMLKTIVAEGGKICLPKQEIGQGMGWIGCFQDTEGNLMGLHEMAKKQKTK